MRKHKTRQDKTQVNRGQNPMDSIKMRPLIVLLITMSISLASQQSRAQCPWNRQLSELNSDCICDFNPGFSPPSGLNLPQDEASGRQQVNRMSVQCSAANFDQLLGALKQTASIELPKELITNELDGLALRPSAEIQEAGNQLASQAKLDLLHVSHSSIKTLNNFTFIVDTAAFSITNNVTTNSTGISSLNLTNSNSSLKNLLPNSQIGHLIVAIQSLHLSSSGIRRIELNAFNGLEWSLTSLSLCDNEIEFVPADSIRRLVNLRVLDLSNNKLASIAGNTFASLQKLQTLRLADNAFIGPELAKTDYGQQQQIQQHSNSASIDLQAFKGLEKNLQDLNMKNSLLTAFPLAIKTLQRLVFLNLAQNKIAQIPSNSFGSMNYLTAINLERNRIARLDDETFAGLESSLSSLSLLGNLLASYPVRALARLRSLGRLDLGFNEITSLPVDSFVGNPRLILIGLDGNPLESLPESAFKPLETQLQGLSMGGKSMNCDCRLSWMLRWQHEHKLHISSRERDPQFCARPNYLRSLVSFVALKPDHLSCDSNRTVHPAYLQTPAGWIVNGNIPSTDEPINNYTTTTILPTTKPIYTTQTSSSSTRLGSFPTTLKGIDEDAEMQTTTPSLATIDLNRLTKSSEFTSKYPEEIEASTLENFTTDIQDLSPSTTTQSTRFSTSKEIDARESQLINKKWKEHHANPFGSRENGNGIFPDYESFLATFEGNQRITNRHGFLPSLRPPKNVTNHDKEPAEILRLKAQQHQASNNQSIQQPSNRPRISNSHTITEIHRHTGNAANGRHKQSIFSLFGTRSNETSSQQNQQRLTNSRPSTHGDHNVTNHNISNNNSLLIPAVPTTVNVYKPISHIYNGNQSSQLPQQVTTQATRSQATIQTPISPLFKGFRSVDTLEDSSARISDASSRISTHIPPFGYSSVIKPQILPGNRISSTSTTPMPRVTDTYVEVASNFQPYLEPPNRLNQTITRGSTTRSLLSVYEQPPTTTMENIMLELERNITRKSSLDNGRELGTIQSPRENRQTTTTTESSYEIPTIPTTPIMTANNTRMSVLSMSRYANSTNESHQVADNLKSKISDLNQRSSDHRTNVTTIRRQITSTPRPQTYVTVTQSDSSPLESATRMAATVRIVESQPTFLIMNSGNPSPSSNTVNSPIMTTSSNKVS